MKDIILEEDIRAEISLVLSLIAHPSNYSLEKENIVVKRVSSTLYEVAWQVNLINDDRDTPVCNYSDEEYTYQEDKITSCTTYKTFAVAEEAAEFFVRKSYEL